MNIAFLNSIPPDEWGGGEKWMVSAAEGLKGCGHYVVLIGKPDSFFLRRAQQVGLTTVPLKIAGDFGPIVTSKLIRLFRRRKIDCLITNFNKDIRLGGVAARLAAVPLVISRNGYPLFSRRLKYFLTYKLVDKIITNTAAIKNRYSSYGWFKDDFIEVIPNGIKVNNMGNGIGLNLRQRFDIPADSKIILTAGRLTRPKGQVYFLKAAQELLKRDLSLSFLIAGSGVLDGKLKGLSRELGIESRVRFLGYQEDLYQIYPQIDLFVLTSLEEGLPNSIMEAMSFGKAVVATDVGGVRELVEDGVTGYVVEPRDVQGIADAIWALINNDSFLKAFGDAGRKKITEQFSMERMVSSLEDFLQENLNIKLGEG